MALDIFKFFQATNPSRTLAVENEEDQKYYIDFASVRGGQIIEKLRNKIAFFSSDEPTCELFTGHIGCGKSTELLRLKADLEQDEFHVVYLESDQDLEMGDVDAGDILLAIARRVSESLETAGINLRPGYFQQLFGEVQEILQTPVQISTDVKFSVGIAAITAQAKSSPNLRDKLRGFLEPRTDGIIQAINQELLEPAIQKLKQQGRRGLVVLVDNLDQIAPAPKAWGRPQPEYLFVDRGTQLRRLNCHIIYTIPLALRFSDDFGRLTTSFMVDPKVLPMAPVQLRDGRQHQEGMALLRQLALARAFPNVAADQRLARSPEVFDSPDTLDRLCRISGGHVRNLLRFLNDWIQEDRQLPLTRESLETVIRTRRNELTLSIDTQEWEALRQVVRHKTVAGNQDYQALIRSMFVYEYLDQEGSWFDINPILAEAKEFQT
ncbi:MAG: AAA family ATPase [Leptolyngbyaceae cyanobacterium MO_188.B28]|nr:AAA family ATPase [Leptolyngbyaceae cyanobacterium MO_188.B28]